MEDKKDKMSLITKLIIVLSIVLVITIIITTIYYINENKETNKVTKTEKEILLIK